MENKHKATIYFNIVRRGSWWMLQDATGSFWGVYGSRDNAKAAIPILKRKYIDELRKRGTIKPREPKNESQQKPS